MTDSARSGMIIHLFGEVIVIVDTQSDVVTLAGANDNAISFGTRRLPDVIAGLRDAQRAIDDGPCPYTQSHTRDTCGHAECRRS
jgi:hypothetical protein